MPPHLGDPLKEKNTPKQNSPPPNDPPTSTRSPTPKLELQLLLLDLDLENILKEETVDSNDQGKYESKKLFEVLNDNLLTEAINSNQVNVPRSDKLCKLNTVQDKCNKSNVGCNWNDDNVCEITNLNNQLVGIDPSKLCNTLTVDDKCNISYNIDRPINQFEPYRESTNAKLTKLINNRSEINTKLETIKKIINNKVCSNLEYYDPIHNICKPLIASCLSTRKVQNDLTSNRCMLDNAKISRDPNPDNLKSLEYTNLNLIPVECNKRPLNKCISTSIDDKCVQRSSKCTSKFCFKRDKSTCNNDVCEWDQDNNTCKTNCSKVNPLSECNKYPLLCQLSSDNSKCINK